MNASMELERFLAAEQRRALKTAEFATGSRDEALDLVQDAMLRLADRYADKPAAEWGPLFQRILTSRINDYHRRRLVRARFMVWFSRDDHARGNPIDELPGDDRPLPEDLVGNGVAVRQVHEALSALPPRQRQAFLLRMWEGYDVKTTAAIMGCGEGSVKTHLSRAVTALRRALGEHGT